MSKLSHYWLLVLFLLLIFLTRLIAIDHFPAFIDETVHIHTAEQLSEISPLFGAQIGRVGTIWYYWLFQPTQSDPIWIARVATLIIVLLGTSALLQLSYRISGQLGLILMGLFLLFSPYHFFFERLALADPIAASFVLIAIAAGYRLRYRVHYWDALLCGGFLALGIFAKTNVIPYAGVVLAALVGFSQRHPIQALIRWFCVSLIALLTPIIAFETLIRITENAWLNAIIRYVRTRSATSTPIWERILSNAQETLVWFSGYMHPVMLIVLFIALLMAILRRRTYLLLVLIAPLFPMWGSNPQETRYWLIPIGLLGLIAAIEIAQIVQKYSWKIQLVPILGLFIWGGFLWLPQVFITANNPLEIPLPDTDRRQYVFSDAIGFSFEQIPDVIPTENRPQIIGLLANCQGLRYSYWDTYEVLCRDVNPDGSDIPELLEWVDMNRGTVPYVILEESSYMPQSIEGNIIATIKRPANRNNLSIYDIRP